MSDRKFNSTRKYGRSVPRVRTVSKRLIYANEHKIRAHRKRGISHVQNPTRNESDDVKFAITRLTAAPHRWYRQIGTTTIMSRYHTASWCVYMWKYPVEKRSYAASRGAIIIHGTSLNNRRSNFVLPRVLRRKEKTRNRRRVKRLFFLF